MKRVRAIGFFVPHHFGVTVVGYLRTESLNLYTGDALILDEPTG